MQKFIDSTSDTTTTGAGTGDCCSPTTGMVRVASRQCIAPSSSRAPPCTRRKSKDWTQEVGSSDGTQFAGQAVSAMEVWLQGCRSNVIPTRHHVRGDRLQEAQP